MTGPIGMSNSVVWATHTLHHHVNGHITCGGGLEVGDRIRLTGTQFENRGGMLVHHVIRKDHGGRIWLSCPCPSCRFLGAHARRIRARRKARVVRRAGRHRKAVA